MKPFINHYGDVLDLLDEKVAGVQWDQFYKERPRPVPFLLLSWVAARAGTRSIWPGRVLMLPPATVRLRP